MDKAATPINQSKPKETEYVDSKMKENTAADTKARPRERKGQSPQKSNTAKAENMENKLDSSYTSPSSTKQQKTGKPKTKIKSSPGVAKGPNVKSAMNIPRSLPAKPIVQPHIQDSAPKSKIKQTRPSATDLKEVPVVQTKLPLYASSASFIGSVQSDPDLILGLPQQYDLLSLSSRTSLNHNINSSREQLQAGSVIDGSSTYRDGASTYRSVVAGSVYSAVTLDNISVFQEQSSVLLSARPLPVPPGQ